MTRTPEQVHRRLMDIFHARPDIATVVNEVVTELLRAEQLHPDWPVDAIHASAVLNEEAGELTKECLDYANSTNKDASSSARVNMHTEGIQTAAMGLRFLMNLPGYKTGGSHVAKS